MISIPFTREMPSHRENATNRNTKNCTRSPLSPLEVTLRYGNPLNTFMPCVSTLSRDSLHKIINIILEMRIFSSPTQCQIICRCVDNSRFLCFAHLPMAVQNKLLYLFCRKIYVTSSFPPKNFLHVMKVLFQFS